jgi:anaerobic selenocysteine-containing dehydrogenase
MCECGVLAHVSEGGEVVALEGDPDHPLSEGCMCPKGLSYLQLAYHPDRLKYPLKRIGEREKVDGSR